jgi:two-component system CheB/CheR fusion protein
MPVVDIEDGMGVQPNHVYVIPPNQYVALLHGHLHLMEPTEPPDQRVPIDFFFASLAQDQGAQSIGILLSGTGSDGTQGLKDIKGAGGMVMVQTPDSTVFPGMPLSALATGLVDYACPPAGLASRLMAQAGRPGGRPSAAVPAPGEEQALARMFILLRSQTGHDFSRYKASAIRRRMERRMAVHQIGRIEDYVRFCQQDSQEVAALFKGVLIGVTSFFRDLEVFQALERTILPRLLASRPDGARLRVWSAGCSTGEEAYGLAMLFEELLEAGQRGQTVQLFATDIDPRAIATARKGLYPTASLAGLSKERRERWLTEDPEEGGYRIRKALRDLVVFSEQDVIRDLPFTRLDLISCRNLLIYLEDELQNKLIPMFHYLLNPGGSLLLGTSETMGASGALFSSEVRENRIFERLESTDPAQKEAIRRFLPSLKAAAPMPGSSMAGVPRDRRNELNRDPDSVAEERRLLSYGGGFPSREAFLQSANDDLRVSNEEMQSINEEMQANNEELETSKEELQSLNEAMADVQVDLQAKVAALAQANNDMNNLLAGTSVGTVFVDRQMGILRFTPSAAQMINLIPGDCGRPIAHIASNLVGYDRLVEDTRMVLEDLLPVEREVKTRAGRWFTLRIQPYRTLENLVEGAVITFVDITDMKATQEALRKANELHRLAVVVRDAHDAITVQDLDGRILAWNPGAVRMYGWTEAEALAMNVRDRIPEGLREDALAKVLELSRAEILEPYLTQRKAKGGLVLPVSITSTALVNEAGQMYAVSTSERTREAKTPWKFEAPHEQS